MSETDFSGEVAGYGLKLSNCREDWFRRNVSCWARVFDGYRKASSADVAKIAAFDQEHQTPQEVIKEMRTNLDFMNKII